MFQTREATVKSRRRRKHRRKPARKVHFVEEEPESSSDETLSTIDDLDCTEVPSSQDSRLSSRPHPCYFGFGLADFFPLIFLLPWLLIRVL